MFISGRNEVLHKSSGYGYSGKGFMKLSMNINFLCLDCIAKIQIGPCTVTLKNLTFFRYQKKYKNCFVMVSKSFVFKATCRKLSKFPEQKFSSENIGKVKYYVYFVNYSNHSRSMFTEEKPM